ncbi:MAG: cyclic nucleotide-binding domain-containing protein [Gammaproteobacteria bacterium]
MPEKKINAAFLRKIPIFSSMSDAELNGILKAPENRIEEFGPKQVIVREMEVADSMYVILDGAAEVLLRGENFGREVGIATLRPGDFFGEKALLNEKTMTGRRTASVRALHMAKVFRIDKKHVQLSLERAALPTEDPTVPHMAPQDREVRTLIKGMRLFHSLTEAELSNIGSWTEVLKVGPGDFVIKESEKGDCMFVVLDGVVEIFALDEQGKIAILATVDKGSYFGEQALMPGSSGQRNAYARANGIARLIKIPKEYFRLVLNRDSEVARSLLMKGQAQKKRRDEVKRR